MVSAHHTNFGSVRVGLATAIGISTLWGCKGTDTVDENGTLTTAPINAAKPMDPLSVSIDAAWDFADPAESKTRFEAMLSGQQTPSNPAASAQSRAEILTQIARCKGLIGDTVGAEKSLSEARELISGTRTRATVRVYLESGRLKNSSRDAAAGVSRGTQDFTEAWNLSRELREDALAVDAAHMLAIALGDDPIKSVEWNERALRYAEASGDERAKRWKASLLNNLGWAYHDLKSYPAALEMFRKALAEREKTPEKRAELLTARWCVGRALRSLGRYADAMQVQRTLELEYAKDGVGDGFNEEELAECLLATGQSDDARVHFGKAYELLSADQWLVSHEPDRLERIRALAFPAR